MNRLLLGLFLCCLTGCKHLPTPTPNKPVTSWQSTDQPPVFPGCEQASTPELQWHCLQDNITKLFAEFFVDHPSVSSHLVQDTLWLHLRIDNSGTMLLDALNESDTSSVLFQDLQKLVSQFPQTSPPTKTNLGVTTQVRFRLPVVVP